MKDIKNISILYVEDDEITRENIAEFLSRKCHTLYTAQNGEEGYEKFLKYSPYIVITDIEMPKLNGIAMAQKIREKSKSTQIIITTAYTNQKYLLKAINLHLVRYITKPLSITKLNEALKDCEEFIDTKNSIQKKLSQDCLYDTYTKELLVKNQIIQLSKNERELLELLIKNHPSSVSYENIEQYVYNFESSKNAIKLLVKALRKKIGQNAISNISSLGYKINLMEKNE